MKCFVASQISMQVWNSIFFATDDTKLLLRARLSAKYINSKIKSSSPVLLRRFNPGRNQFHHQNRSKELCLEKNDSPIGPSTHLTSEIFHYRRPFGNRARNFFRESSLLHWTNQANQSRELLWQYQRRLLDCLLCNEGVKETFYCEDSCTNLQAVGGSNY